MKKNIGFVVVFFFFLNPKVLISFNQLLLGKNVINKLYTIYTIMHGQTLQFKALKVVKDQQKHINFSVTYRMLFNWSLP